MRRSRAPFLQPGMRYFFSRFKINCNEIPERFRKGKRYSSRNRASSWKVILRSLSLLMKTWRINHRTRARSSQKPPCFLLCHGLSLIHRTPKPARFHNPLILNAMRCHPPNLRVKIQELSKAMKKKKENQIGNQKNRGYLQCDESMTSWNEF